MENPDIYDAIGMWRTCEGQAGIEGTERLTGHALEAMAVIDEARAAKLEEEMKVRRD